MKLILLSLLFQFEANHEPSFSIIIKAETQDSVTIYCGDSTLNYGRVPSPSFFKIFKKFQLRGGNQYDTLEVSLVDLDTLKSLALRLGDNHPNYSKRIKKNKINIEQITIHSDQKENQIIVTKENFFDYFNWNVYVDSIGIADDIEVYTKQWYYNIHPFIFVDLGLLKGPAPNSYIELLAKNKSLDVIDVKYNYTDTDSLNIDYHTSGKVLLLPSENFRKVRIPFYSEKPIRKFNIRLGYFGSNEFHLKSIKVSSGDNTITYNYYDIKDNFAFNQFIKNKSVDSASFWITSNISGNVYYPEMETIGGIRYSSELFLDKLVYSLKFILLGITLVYVNKFVFRNIITH